MAAGTDRPGARTRAATLRIKRGAKTLSEIALGRAKLVIGGGATAQLRLKNAGLADECIVLDTREATFRVESRLGPDQVLVNGWAVETATVKPGDRIEFSGITLELVSPDAEESKQVPVQPQQQRPAAKDSRVDMSIAIPRAGPASEQSRPVPAARPPSGAAPAAGPDTSGSAADDPYMGRRTAARMRRDELEAEVAKLRADRDRGTDNELPSATGGIRRDPTLRDGPATGGIRRDPTQGDLPPARPRNENITDRELPEASARSGATLRDNPASSARSGATQRDLPAARSRNDNLTDRDLPSAGAPRKDDSASVVGAIGEPGPQATGFSRPPWLESVGDAATAGAKLYLLQSVVEVGRQGEVRVNHPSVSKKHARFIARGATLKVEDLGSTNGTWVNREKITGARALKNGDTVHFGAAEFKISIPGVAPEASIAPVEFSSTSELESRQLPNRAPPPSEPPVVRGTVEPVSAPVRRPAAPPPPPAARRDDSREVRSPTERAPDVRRRTEEARPARAPAAPPRAERSGSFEFSPNPEGSVLELDEPLARPATRSPWADADEAPRDRSRSQEVRRARTGTFVNANAAPDEPLAPARRGAPIALFAAGGFFAILVVGAAALFFAWPQVRAFLAKGPVAVAANETPTHTAAPGRTPVVANTPTKAGPVRTPAKGTHTPVGVPQTPIPVIETPTPTPEPTTTLRPGQLLASNEHLDIGGDSRLNSELNTLDRGSNGNHLRAEREINAEALQSLYLDDGTAVIRRFHSDDGFTLAPSAADAGDAEDRKVGAKQISGDKVNGLIRAHFGEVKRCLVGGHIKGGRARVVVQFTIQPTGKVGDSRVIESDIAGGSFQSCVSSVVKKISFPKPKDQAVVVQFPFVFTLNQ